MSFYARPSIVAPVFRDAEGRTIDYGNRWSGSPPEETYSVDTHPERFAPLHIIADALIAHLHDTYDVDLVEGAQGAVDLLHPIREVVRAVQVLPHDATCAPLTFVFSAYPGVFLHAGLLHDFAYPVCGCDACDSTWQAEADDLERLVLAVASGHYRERIDRGIQTWIDYAVTYPGGDESGRSRAQDVPAQRLKAARPVLRDLAQGWSAWPLRQES